MAKLKLGPVLRMAFAGLYLNGINPLKQNKYTRLIALVSVLMQTVFVALFAGEVINRFDDISSLSNASNLPGTIVLFFKIFSFLYNRKRICKCVDLLQTFWPLSQFGEVKEKRYLKIHRNIKWVYNSYIVFAYLLGAQIFCAPIFESVNRIPIPMIPVCDVTINTCFVIFLSYMNFYCFYIFLIITLSYDGFFIAMLTHAYIQIDLIKNAIDALNFNQDEDRIMEDIGYIIDQHVIVLEYIQELKYIFSGVFVIIFLTTILTAPLALILMTMNGIPPNFKSVSEYGMMAAIWIFEFMIYCYGGTLITEQCLSVSDSLFKTNWWIKTQPRVRKTIGFMILRSLKAEKLSIGGMTNLDLACFIMLLKNIASIFTLLGDN